MLIALLCGGLMPFAYAPYDQSWLAIVALAGWAWLLRCDHPFRISFAFGFGWFGFGAWWLADTFHLYGHLPWLAAYGIVALVGVVLGLFPALWGWAAHRLAPRPAWLLLTLPLLGIIEEWLRGHIFTGLPWTAIGNLILDTPAVGWGAVLGVYGVTLFPVLLATGAALSFDRQASPYGSGMLLLVVIAGLLAPAPYTADGPERTALLVQPDIPQDQKWDRAFLEESMQRLERLSAHNLADTDLIVWPEAAVPFFLSRAPQWDARLKRQMKSWQRPVLFGGLRLVGGPNERAAQNGLFLQRTDGERPFVGKHHLVPFGEYVPEWLPFVRKLVPDIGDFLPASDSGVLNENGTTYGALICYESIFPEQARARVANGANVLVVVTNDAWYGKSPAAWQHLQAARMRAVENGRYVLRAANTGVSAIIAPNGAITATAPWWTQTVVRGTYRSSDQITPYQRWGDLPALLLTGLALLALVGRSRE
jgi:apolipoprotein N-acyltransferase